MSEFKPAERRLQMSVGDSVRVMRELQELSQNELASICGIPQSTLSAIENDRINLGLDHMAYRSEMLALCLKR